MTPKWHWTLKGQTTSYIYMTTTHKSQVSFCLALWTAVFKLLAILGQVHRMTPQWPWTLKCQRYPIYMWQLQISLFHCMQSHFRVTCCNYPWVPIYPLFHSTASRFWVIYHFETILMTPKWPWTLKGQSYPHIHVTTTPGCQISTLFGL